MSTWDISLGGQDFMLVPGSYQRTLQREPERSEYLRGELRNSVGALSSLLQAGALGPAPASRNITGTIANGSNRLVVSDSQNVYIIDGVTLYRWNKQLSTAPVARKTLPAAATAMVRLRGWLYIGFGAAADVAVYDDVTNTLIPSALGAGLMASQLAVFSRGIVLVTPTSPAALHIVYGNGLNYRRTWTLDGHVRSCCQLGQHMIVATDAGLHLLSGDWYQDIDPPAPPETLRVTSWGTQSGMLQQADDFAWMIVFAGRLYAWIGRQVMVLNESQETWQPAGLAGQATHGAAVVGGRLQVSVLPHGGSLPTLASFDGSSWMTLATALSQLALRNITADGAGRLLAFTSGSGTIATYSFDEPDVAASLVGSWSAIFGPFLVPGNGNCRFNTCHVTVERNDGLSVGNWTLACDYSLDDGVSWNSTGPPAAVTRNVAALSYPLGVSGQRLLIRLTATAVSGLSPLITSVGVSSQTAGASKRRWKLRIDARARGIDRDGGPDLRSPQQVRDAMWGLADSGVAQAFVDVDGVAHNVLIAALRDEWPQTVSTDSHSRLDLELLET